MLPQATFLQNGGGSEGDRFTLQLECHFFVAITSDQRANEAIWTHYPRILLTMGGEWYGTCLAFL
jgi:hypothetical protein